MACYLYCAGLDCVGLCCDEMTWSGLRCAGCAVMCCDRLAGLVWMGWAKTGLGLAGLGLAGLGCAWLCLAGLGLAGFCWTHLHVMWCTMMCYVTLLLLLLIV